MKISSASWFGTSLIDTFAEARAGITVFAPGAVNPACTDPTSANPGTTPNNCDLLNVQNFKLTGDPTSSGGTKRKGKFVSAYGIPMLETTASGNGTPLNTPGIQGSSTTWFHTSMVNLSFLVNPAQAPPPT